MDRIVDFIQQNWELLSTITVLVLWLLKAKWDGVLGDIVEDAVRRVLATLVTLAKEYLDDIPKDVVLQVAYAVYDADSLLPIPAWLSTFIGYFKEKALGTRIEFGEKMYELWLRFIATQEQERPLAVAIAAKAQR